ncbi:MAG: polysaccharide biosynthesis protein [Clostridia bacterium]|nr:polysaccharide biosynthesis protein [Clostridia bacterium]
MSELQKKEPRMMTGVAVLMLASLFEKILGVFFKIPLFNTLGSVGMGYFNAAYSIFSTFYTISLTGFPIAVSIMISRSGALGRKEEIKKTFRTALTVFFALGAVGSSIMFFGSDIIADLIDRESNSSLCIKAIAPILLIICISSSIKGYFQGHKNMFPTAISEFLDALGKCALGVIAAIYASKAGHSTEVCAAYAIAGVTVGHLLGLGYLAVVKALNRPTYNAEITDESAMYPKLLRTLFSIAIPITVSSMALGLMSNIDTFTIMNCLKTPGAMAQYGDYTTLAITLFRLPQAFILPISAALTPTLTSAISSMNAERTKTVTSSALKLAAIIAIPSALGMGVLALPIIYLLFGKGEVSAEISTVAPYLSILSVGIVFMAALTVTSSILQAHKKQKMPVISAFFGALTKLVLNIILVSSFGMIGAPISSVVGYFVMAAINFGFVIKYAASDVKPGKIVVKPLISALIMTVFAAFSYYLLHYLTSSIKISVVVAIILSAVLYVFLLIIIKGIEKDDVLLMPGGDKIYNVLKKIKLMK